MVAPSNTEIDPLEAAANALKSGNIDEARSILSGVISKDPGNIAAWELVYQASKNDSERIYSLNAILKLDPGNPLALQKLAKLQPIFNPDAISEEKTKPSTPSKTREGKKRNSAMYLLGFFVGIAGLACVILWVAVLYRWRAIPSSLPADRTLTALAASHADCQQLIDKALAASSNVCNRVGSNQACYGNNTVKALLVPGTVQQFASPGDIVGVNQLESISASMLDPTRNEWGIAIFKVISNLPRSLPGETITLVVFGNTTLENSTSLETYYFYSGLGQVACDQIPFDGLMVTMPEGTGIHFMVNGSVLTLMGNASLRAQQNGSMDVSLYSGSGSIESNGQQQVFTAGESVSVPLGGPNGTDSIGPPSSPQPLSPGDLAVVCSMTGKYCNPSDITPVPSVLAAQWIQTANANTSTRTPTPSFTPSPTATPSPSATATGTATSTPSATSTPTHTPTRTLTRTFTPTWSLTRTPTFPPADTVTSTHTSTATLTSTQTDTPTATLPTPTATQTDTPTEILPIPTATFTPTDTPTTILGTVFAQIIVPSDGEIIYSDSQTKFEVIAYDTALGIENGDGIDHVDFWFSGPTVIGSNTEYAPSFCAFGNAGPTNCNTMGGILTGLTSGTTYTMYVRAYGTISGDSGVVWATFKIP